MCSNRAVIRIYSDSTLTTLYICDQDCENRACGHKLHSTVYTLKWIWAWQFCWIFLLFCQHFASCLFLLFKLFCWRNRRVPTCLWDTHLTMRGLMMVTIFKNFRFFSFHLSWIVWYWYKLSITLLRLVKLFIYL